MTSEPGTQGPRYTNQGVKVTEHWNTRSLTYEGAVEELRRRELDLSAVTPEILHSMDMLHMGGLGATDALAQAAEINPGNRVLDAGSGVGGPARRYADRYGAEVWGIELARHSYETALRLTDLVRLQDRVHFTHGSVLELPFEDAGFHVVTMAHVAMQISEKDQLFGELARVLKPGGRLALHEIFGGSGGDAVLPLAWADDPSMSALEMFSDCADRLEGLGFLVGEPADLSEEGRRFHENGIKARRAALAQGTGRDGLSPDALKERLRGSISMERNLRERRLQVMMVVAKKREEA